MGPASFIDWHCWKLKWTSTFIEKQLEYFGTVTNIFSSNGRSWSRQVQSPSSSCSTRRCIQTPYRLYRISITSFMWYHRSSRCSWASCRSWSTSVVFDRILKLEVVVILLFNPSVGARRVHHVVVQRGVARPHDVSRRSLHNNVHESFLTPKQPVGNGLGQNAQRTSLNFSALKNATISLRTFPHYLFIL